MSGTIRKKPPLDRLVFRSLHMFEDDDTELRMIAAGAGVTKSELIRGIVHAKLTAWQQMTANKNVAPPEFLDDLTDVIQKGSVSKEA